MPNDNESTLRREAVGGYPRLTPKRATHVNLRDNDGKELSTSSSQPDDDAAGLVVREAGTGGTAHTELMDVQTEILLQLKAIRAYLAILTDEHLTDTDVNDLD